MRRLLCSAFLALAALSPAASAQMNFFARFAGGAVVPATPSPFTGRGHFELNLATHHVTFRIETNIVGAIGVDLREAAAGANGALVQPLFGGPTVWYGMMNTLPTAQLLSLCQGNLYVVVRTVAFPAGEIRGQLLPQYQRFLTASLNGAEAGTASTVTGTASANADLPENVVIYRLATGAFATPVVSALLKVGVASYPLAAVGGNVWCGTIALPNATQVGDLLNGNAFFEVHTVAFPGGMGEIRGKVQPTTEHFVAVCDATQSVPPVASANTAIGRFHWSAATHQLTYTASWSGAAGLNARVQIGDPLVGGGIAFFLAGPANGPWAGVSAALTAAQEKELFERGLYLNVTSAPFPAGEVRGQLWQDPSILGFAGATTAGPLGRRLRITSIGQPTLGNPAFGVALADALPAVPLSLAYGENLLTPRYILDPVGAPGHCLWLDPLVGFGALADACGCGSRFFAVPGIAALAGIAVYFQWLAPEAANPLGFVFSDALRVVLY